MDDLSAEQRLLLCREIESALNTGTITLGEAIRRIRSELYGMTQTEYAAYSGVSDKTLRDIEKGQTDPRLSVLHKLLAPGGFTLSARFVPRRVT